MNHLFFYRILGVNFQQLNFFMNGVLLTEKHQKYNKCTLTMVVRFKKRRNSDSGFCSAAINVKQGGR